MKQTHIPDKRTYTFHQKAAEILRASPDRLNEVRDVLTHWLTLTGTQAESWAEKWQELIDGLCTTEVADLICKQGEEMDFYRKSSPFACLLSDEQRMEIIRRFKYDHE
ncbi:hypothetical protein [Teredinibacter turnerae]|uniref:hypothetical protein n=1 Tax=Teredinibacter turnerae TaxID=2426 RepID=UPI00036E7B8F|nr:hypothetical protein [Teredinibacter turnerae]